jgi:hypothetical protein
MVRSRANERPYRKWVCWPLPGHLASWIYTRGVILGERPAVVCLAVKPVGKPGAGNRHARFDERGWETGVRHRPQATAASSTLPISDIGPSPHFSPIGPFLARLFAAKSCVLALRPCHPCVAVTDDGVHGILLHRRGCPRSRLLRSFITHPHNRRGEQQGSPRDGLYAVMRNSI